MISGVRVKTRYASRDDNVPGFEGSRVGRQLLVVFGL